MIGHVRVTINSRRDASARTRACCCFEDWQLAGRGLGWIDVHPLAAARLAGTPLWTFDKSLQVAAEKPGISAVFS